MNIFYSDFDISYQPETPIKSLKWGIGYCVEHDIQNLYIISPTFAKDFESSFFAQNTGLKYNNEQKIDTISVTVIIEKNIPRSSYNSFALCYQNGLFFMNPEQCNRFHSLLFIPYTPEEFEKWKRIHTSAQFISL